MLIGDKKFSCQSCIKGHRATTCKHSDRPLFEVKKKGRPPTQCQHCRDLRKTKSVHVKCECEGKISDHHRLPDLPHGIKDLSTAKTELGCKSCECHSGQECTCVGLVHQDPPLVMKAPSTVSTTSSTVSQASFTPPISQDVLLGQDILHSLDQEETLRLLDIIGNSNGITSQIGIGRGGNCKNGVGPTSDISANPSDHVFDLVSLEGPHDLVHHRRRSHHNYSPYGIPNMLHSPSNSQSQVQGPAPTHPLPVNLRGIGDLSNGGGHSILDFTSPITPLNTPVEVPPQLGAPFGVNMNGSQVNNVNYQNLICQCFGTCVCGMCSVSAESVESGSASEKALSLCPDQCAGCSNCNPGAGITGQLMMMETENNDTVGFSVDARSRGGGRDLCDDDDGREMTGSAFFDVEQWLRGAPAMTMNSEWAMEGHVEQQQQLQQDQGKSMYESSPQWLFGGEPWVDGLGLEGAMEGEREGAMTCFQGLKHRST